MRFAKSSATKANASSVLGAVEWNQRVYVIGGNDAQGQYSTDVPSARFDIGLP